MINWEDLEPGRVSALGSRTVTREEIVDFASQWDPQGFQLDEEAGRRPMFGGLVASGWNTACICLYAPLRRRRPARRRQPRLNRHVGGELAGAGAGRGHADRDADRAGLPAVVTARRQGGSALVEWQGTNQDGAVVLVMPGIFR